MASSLSLAASPKRSLPIAPTEEAWRAMALAERERFLIQVNEALSDPLVTMSEGRPHKRAKSRAVDMLGLHFKAMGKVIYLAEEMGVVYPGAEVFTPDVLAVLDVEQREDDERLAWVVADEGRGLDLAFEVLHRGDRKKDLVDNVERYASLGIPEYFIYDWGKQQLYGYRLAGPGAKKYQRIVPQAGRYHSIVLGLDLVLQQGALQFYLGMSALIGSGEVINRLAGMVESLEAKAEAAEAKAEQATSKAEEATVKVEQAVASTRQNIFGVLVARGIACSEGARARIVECADLAVLQGWLVRALSVAAAEEIF